MEFIGHFRRLTPVQRNTFIACFLGWSLDAFDFFILIFCVNALATQFQTKVSAIAEAIFLTLAMRPVGAFLFGLMADRFGRRPTLMLDIIAYSVFELASAFAPSLKVFLIMRACFGIAMGGEWGVGAALAFETLPAKGRGFFSGLLQEGYVLGFLLASLVSRFAFEHVGWRGMFVIGAAPALLVFYIRRNVGESPAWLAGNTKRLSAADLWAAVKSNLGLFLYMVLLMACFNAFSHGSQDLNKPFLLVQRGFANATADTLIIVMNVGALLGGICFGALSERLGRKRAIALAALLALPMIPLWAFAQTPLPLALGGFLMQFMVQGAWGIVPAHLNELSPGAVRAILPGFAYQLGNFVMSQLSPIQARIAEGHGNDYATMLAWTIGVVAVLLALVTLLGSEAKSIEMGAAAA